MSTPNQVCTCGFRKFRERSNRSTASASRWILIEGTNGGLGSPALGGSFMGDGGSPVWAQVPFTLYQLRSGLYCENCKRERSYRLTEEIGVVGTRFTAAGIFVIGVGALTATELEFVGFGRTYTTTPSHAVNPDPWWALESPITTGDEPLGTVATTVVFFPYPDPMDSGEYTVNIVSSSFEIFLGLVNLEAAKMFSINDANITPSPDAWRNGDSRLLSASGQPEGEPTGSIPFDKCDAVVEFDGSQGELPDAQGWSYNGTASQSVWTPRYGAAQFEDVVAETSYWSKSVAITSSPEAVYLQSAYQVSTNPYTNPAAEIRAVAAMNTFPYFGAHLLSDTDRTYTKSLDGTVTQPLGAPDAASWTRVAAASSGTEDAVWYRGGDSYGTTYFGQGTVSVTSHLTVEFGARAATTGRVLWRNVIASAPGRFVRALFAGYCAVEDPVLRLYMRADNGSSTDKSARFRIKFGTAPDQLSTTIDQTAIFLTANQVLEVPIQLTGLGPGTYWWTVERVWDHTDDKLRETVHLLYATVRGS